jgi:beta-lactamase regulating signal transducer with metallopeptidase domain
MKLFAYCVGIKNSQIYVSSGLVAQMNAKELEAILLHEKSHLDNRDPLVLTLLSLTQNLFPYLPILSDLIRNFRIEREIRADKSAVSQQGEMQPLLSAMKKLLLVPDSGKFVFSVGIGELDTLEVRIHTLLKKNPVYKKFHLLNLLVTTLTILVVGFAVLTPVHAIENHADGKDVMMICPNNDSCVSWCQRNQSITPNQPVENSSHPYSTK